MMSREKQEKRRQTFKQGINPEEARKKREEDSFNIRKSTREENVRKRRQLLSDLQDDEHAGGMVDVNMNDSSLSSGAGSSSSSGQNQGEEVMALAHVILSGNTEVTSKCHALREIRTLLSTRRTPPIEQVIAADLLPILVHFLDLQAPHDLQFEAAWILTNISSGTSEQTAVVVQAQAINPLVALLSSPHDDIREQAVWALGNIAGDCANYSLTILEAGAMPPLIHCVEKSKKVSLPRMAVWTISNLCRGRPYPPFSLVEPALDTLVSQLFTTKDEEIRTDACWAMSLITSNKDSLNAVVLSGVCRRLVHLTMDDNMSIKIASLRTLGNIVSGADQMTQVVLNVGALPCLYSGLQHESPTVRREASWIVSNIMAGNQHQIQRAIVANFIPILVNMMKNDEFELKKEAAFAICNATLNGDQKQLMKLIDLGCIPPLCELLKSKDMRVIGISLEGIRNFLKAAQLSNSHLARDAVESSGALERISELQNHDNDAISGKAVEIEEKYFSAQARYEDDGDVAM